MHLAHRTRVAATTGDGKLRTLNIKGLVIGCSIVSDNIRKWKMQGNWTLVTIKINAGQMWSREKMVKCAK